MGLLVPQGLRGTCTSLFSITLTFGSGELLVQMFRYMKITVSPVLKDLHRLPTYPSSAYLDY